MLICDIWATGIEHYEFNFNVLKLLSRLFCNKEIFYIGNEEQVNKFSISLQKINFYKINTIKITKKNKIKIIFIYIINLLKIRKFNSDKIIILNSLPIIILLAKIILFSKKDIYFFLHGLDKLEDENKGSYKFFLFVIRLFNSDRYKYIVLGDVIKKNLLKKYPSMEKQLFSIDHPYSFSKNNINKRFDNKIIISTCGITAYEKGLNNIYKFIDKIENNFEFKHIGKSINEIQDKYVKYFPYKNEVISQKEYKNLIDKLDYILILYPNDSYKLTASGVYFDCIKFNKPLLGLKNEYFEYMFEKYGEIGKLFNTIEEIIDYLKKNREILEQEQNIFWKNMEKIRETLNKNVEKNLLRIIYQEETK